ISSTFGMRMHPVHKTWMGHKGVDYAAPTGTPIHSTADGTVEFAGQQRGYGNVVIIKHFGKYSTVYAHQSRIAPGIKKGSKVSQGQLIGYVGSAGWATGPHHVADQLALRNLRALFDAGPADRLRGVYRVGDRAAPALRIPDRQ